VAVHRQRTLGDDLGDEEPGTWVGQEGRTDAGDHGHQAWLEATAQGSATRCAAGSPAKPRRSRRAEVQSNIVSKRILGAGHDAER
jgi:hypothetical protein